MSNKPRGGRGNTAPYQTTHVRLPVGIKTYVEKIIDDYRDRVLRGEIDPEVDIAETDEFALRLLPELDELCPIARQILSQNRSARESICELLTFLYHVDIDPDSL